MSDPGMPHPDSKLFEDITHAITLGFAPEPGDPHRPEFHDNDDETSRNFLVTCFLVSVGCDVSVFVKLDLITNGISVMVSLRDSDGEQMPGTPSILLGDPTAKLACDTITVFIGNSHTYISII